jgi:hypothetical protein
MQASTKLSKEDSVRSARTVRSSSGLVDALVVLIPSLLTFFFIYTFAVEMPIQDDWDLFVPHFCHLAAGQLHWNDVVTQHNEHIVGFPLAASLMLSKASGGRFLSIIYLSYLFLCGSLGMLFLFFRMLALDGRFRALWFLPVAVLFLGWRQSEGILSATHVVITMALFFVLAALYCCFQVQRAPIFFPLAIMCAWIASFSMGSGNLVWIFGIPILATRRRDHMVVHQIVRWLTWWIFNAALCITVFVLNLKSFLVGWPTGYAFVSEHPRDAFMYALIYLGGPLSSSPRESLFIGGALVAIALAALCFGLKTVLRSDAILAGTILAAYVFVALIPLLGRRLGLGIDQGFASRYVTTSALAPIGLYFSLLGLGRKSRACRYLAGGMLALLLAGIFNSYTSGLMVGPVDKTSRSACAEVLKTFPPADHRSLLCMYPDPGIVLDRAPLLQRFQLSLFHR